jgi:MFS family permease
VVRQRTGILLAGAAILALGPRLVLTFLAADRHKVDGDWTAALLIASGVGAALVLVAGNIYLAHKAADLRSRFLTILWLVVLACSGVLAAPLVVARLKGVELDQVLVSSTLQWLWSLFAVVATELIAGGCMLADAAGHRTAEQLEQQQRELGELRAELARQQERASRAEQQARELSTAARARGPVPLRAVEGEPAGVGAEPIEVPCRNAARGCPEVFKGVMGERGHQRTCEFKTAAGVQ